MKKERNQKLICLLLIFAVMIFGICLEKIPANSYFSCKETSAIAKAENVIRNVSAYRTETLREREVLSFIRTTEREVRRNQNRTNYLLDFCLSGTEILSQKFRSKQVMDKDDSYRQSSCSAAILSYIHKQDGEKAPHLIFS